MNKRGVGVVFCFMAVMLIGMHYLTAAIYLSNVQTWSKELFLAGLEYTGNLLDILSVIMLVVGVVYLFLGEKENKK